MPAIVRFTWEDIIYAFFDKVSVGGDNECWEWNASKIRGYGSFQIHGKTKYSHILSYELFVGPVPKGLFVLHKCDNPPCVNPNHLFPGTQKQNMEDCAAKGRCERPELRGALHWCAKLEKEDVLAIRSMYAKGKYTQIQIAKLFEVSRQAVQMILYGNTWRHI